MVRSGLEDSAVAEHKEVNIEPLGCTTSLYLATRCLTQPSNNSGLGQRISTGVGAVKYVGCRAFATSALR